ncbi:hypothetical protein H6G41_16445 [Tolypothrix sp. FACHB-123]|uniref:WD40 domain-containing protein n=1 Tax=Tolypothrix sp. FACHB-123 TaxID=2692868 RepID=UPI001681D3ED|nr:NB-ARC domain-containing protein [Tolypothrix sp. FACHB-123]MBD2356196.1 hypothetical protein [Tolypothrix sp. FACHB-123]
MESHKQRRRRGVVLSLLGFQKLQEARYQVEVMENDGARFTLEELSYRTQLAPFTVSKVLARAEGVDKQTLEYFFRAFGLELTPSDYRKAGGSGGDKGDEGDGGEKELPDFSLSIQNHATCYNAGDPTPVATTGGTPATRWLRNAVAPKSKIQNFVDWGEAVDVSIFFGRTEEVSKLEYWILSDLTRLVALLGMGGIGKTSLGVKLAQQIQAEFEFVVWRSLRNSPPLAELLVNLLQFFACGQPVNLSENVGDLVSQFMAHLRSHRCLVILDNAESIFASGDRSGCYQLGYENYGQLFQQLGETAHQSCVLLTSREKPQEVAALEGENLPVRSWQLKGLSAIAALELIRTKSFFCGTDTDWQNLIQHYTGNPLALKIVATTIQELFDGNIGEFFAQGSTVFGSIYDLINQQFHRLSVLEKELMFWLAINREPVNLVELRADLVLPVASMKLLEALDSLSRRSLIEKGRKHTTLRERLRRTTPLSVQEAENRRDHQELGHKDRNSEFAENPVNFTLQPVVMEYVTAQLIQEACAEISGEKSGNYSLFHSHALIKATSKDYIRVAQTKLILQPIIERLLQQLRTKQAIENRLKEILQTLQQQSLNKWEQDVGRFSPELEPTYIGGNILNLLCHLEIDLTGYDFSCLTIWQAYLQDTSLKQVNFAYADLSNSVFAKTLSTVISNTFSPDGKILATAHFDGHFCLWDVKSGQQLITYQGHIGFIWSVAFNPDGKTFVTAGEDANIKIWDVETGQCIQTIQGHDGGVLCVRFSRDGKTLISSSADFSIKIWDLSLGECTKTLTGHSNRVWSVALSPQHPILVSGSEDHSIKLWDLTTGECIQTLHGHGDWLKSLAFSSQGLLVSGSLDKTIRLWDIERGVCLGALTGHLNGILAIAFVDDSNILASCSIDGTIRLWDITTQQCLKTLQGHNNSVNAIAANPQGTQLASGADDFCLRFWDVASGECFRVIKGRSNWIKAIAYHPIFPDTIATGSEDRTVRIWTTDGQCRILSGHTDLIFAVDFTPDGSTIASASADRTIRLWNVSTGQCTKILHGHTGMVTGVAFSPDGRLLASSCYDNHIRLWDTSTGQLLDTLPVHLGMSIAFSPDGKKLAAGSFDQTVRIWDLETRQCYQTLTGNHNWVWSVAFSPDNRTFATGSSFEGITRLWDIETGECLHVLCGHQDLLWAIAFSPDGKMLASCSSDETIKLWDVASGDCLATLTGHNTWVMCLAFSPDGTTLIAGDAYAEIKFWNTQTWRSVNSLNAEQIYHEMNIYGITGLTPAQKSNLLSLGARG